MSISHSFEYSGEDIATEVPSWIARRSTALPDGTVVGVPLEPDVGVGRRPPSPIDPGSRIDLGGVGRVDRQSEDLVEGVTPESDGQGDLLVLLRSPSGAVHHPEEVRLDPGHPAHSEAAAEIAVEGGEVTDCRVVSLVHDH